MPNYFLMVKIALLNFSSKTIVNSVAVFAATGFKCCHTATESAYASRARAAASSHFKKEKKMELQLMRNTMDHLMQRSLPLS